MLQEFDVLIIFATKFSDMKITAGSFLSKIPIDLHGVLPAIVKKASV